MTSKFWPDHGEILTSKVVVRPGPGERLPDLPPGDRGALRLHQPPERRHAGIPVHVARVQPDRDHQQVIDVCSHGGIYTQSHAAI